MRKLYIFIVFFVICFTINAWLGLLSNRLELFILFWIAFMLTMVFGDKIIKIYEEVKDRKRNKG